MIQISSCSTCALVTQLPIINPFSIKKNTSTSTPSPHKNKASFLPSQERNSKAAMAVLPCKRLLLLILIILCCYLNTALAGRNLGMPQIGNVDNQKAKDDDLKVKFHDEHFTSTDDLVAMDYTPASKKPPIHN